MDTIAIKRGDTLQLTCNYKQAGTSTPVDLSTFTITVSILNSDDTAVIEINSNAPTINRSVTTDGLVNGTFSIMVKDTEVLVDDSYFVDFKYTTASGIEQTSKAIKLLVKGKLI
jgi:hypothetical protein